MPDSKKSKKIIPSQKKSSLRDNVVLLPELQSILDDASHIVGVELAKMRRRAEQASVPMDPQTARVFQGYVKSAVDLSRESRERDKEDETGELSDQDLLDMFLDSMPKEDVVRLLQDKINKKEQNEE